jgi:hypothetical protein
LLTELSKRIFASIIIDANFVEEQEVLLEISEFVEFVLGIMLDKVKYYDLGKQGDKILNVV